ncbi:MAG: PIN domain-containing protein [Paludibacter sp.]|nr:PIN domain-containing protein [Paludibacter sp.]
MRYYLDTNILIYILSESKDDICFIVKKILADCANIFYTSSVAVEELIFLHKIGKIDFIKYTNIEELTGRLKSLYGIETIFFNNSHHKQYLSLQIEENHKDMNDHLIISQAISDKVPIISSDNKFSFYEKQKLKFVFNKR